MSPTIEIWRKLGAAIRYEQAQRESAVGVRWTEFREGRCRGLAEALVLMVTDDATVDSEAVDALLADVASLPYEGYLRLPEAQAKMLLAGARRRDRA